MAQRRSTDEQLIADLELALRDPAQRQRLADFFAILNEWFLERKSQEPSAPNEKNSATQSDQALLKNRSTRLAGGIGQEESSQCFFEVRIPQK
jgi:hypothetical protein